MTNAASNVKTVSIVEQIGHVPQGGLQFIYLIFYLDVDSKAMEIFRWEVAEDNANDGTRIGFRTNSVMPLHRGSANWNAAAIMLTTKRSNGTVTGIPAVH